MNKNIIYIVLISTFFIALLFSLFIPILKRIKFGQSIREDGPRSHEIKKGTPTMGGILIIICSIILYFILIKINNNFIDKSNIILLIIPFIGYGIIGFIDDLLIIIKKNNIGLKPLYKFLLELLIGTIYYFIYLGNSYDNTVNFFGVYVDFGFLYGVILVVLFSGFTNATNFTDGLDGLLSITAITSFIGIFIYAMILNNTKVMYLCISLIITLISFLVFNFPKARIFMGDTGSLSIGGVMISMLVELKSEILILFFGFIYFLEVFSVILQVWFYKRTKGRRILKMAPIHHHFELSGYSEYQIDLLFSIINLLFVVIGIMFGVNMFG